MVCPSDTQHYSILWLYLVLQFSPTQLTWMSCNTQRSLRTRGGTQGHNNWPWCHMEILGTGPHSTMTTFNTYLQTLPIFTGVSGKSACKRGGTYANFGILWPFGGVPRRGIPRGGVKISRIWGLKGRQVCFNSMLRKAYDWIIHTVML